MAESRTLAGFRAPLLFLKATKKKQVFIPTYTRHDGVVVPGHYAMVHVADDHSGEKILGGQGTHSQKQAHAKLKQHKWFHELPDDHKVHVLMEHATDIQDKASTAAVLSTFRKKILSGQKPTPAEWKAFDAAPDAKQEAFIADFKAAGKEDEFGKQWFDWSAANPKKPTVATAPVTAESFEPKPAAAAPKPAAKPTAPKVVAAAPKPAQASPEPAPTSGPSSTVSAHVDAINAAKLPASNTNASSVNSKLAAIAKATAEGDVKSLLMMGYGSNNYGAKAAKLANQSLELLGSTEKVSPGQKFGSHPGMKAAVAPAATPAKPAPKAPSKTSTPPVNSPALAQEEIPKAPAGISKGNAATIHKFALAGDVAGLKAYAKKANDVNAVKTAVYSAQVAALMTAKAALGSTSAATAALAPTTTTQPTTSSGTPSVSELLANHPEGMFPLVHKTVAQFVAEGDKAGLKNFAASMTGSNAEWANEVADAMPGAAEDEGPKEGDTKQGSEGLLVFTNGRWHKQSLVSNPPTAAQVPIEGATFTNTTGGHSKFWTVGVQGTQLHTHYGKIGAKGSKTVKQFASGIAAQAAAAKLIKEKQAKGYVSKGQVSMDVASSSAPKVVSATQTAPQATPDAAAPESIDGWKKTGGQQGYNEGGTYVDPQGAAWYCKFPAGGEKVAKNELLAAKLYALAGVNSPDVKLVSQGGKIGIASKMIDGAKQDKAALLSGTAPGLLSGFAVDAWLANWDTVGNNPAKGYDNILIQKDGSAVRIDAGGALLYGGAGGKKQVFTDKVIELKTMLDPAKNAHTAAVFGKMTQSDIAASVAKVAAIPDEAIEAYAMTYGPGDTAQRKRLADTLIARKNDMLAQYPQAAKKSKPPTPTSKQVKPDPTALKVDPTQLPKPHDFMNWNGSGKPISDKPYVKQNVADEKAILDFALKGNLVALKEYKFQPVDKLTGEPVGSPLSMDKHPSNYVRDFYDNCVSFLDVIANPPEPMRTFSGKAAGTIEQLSSLFKPFEYGVSVGKAPANQRLGFWIALGAVETPAKFKPKKVGSKLTAAAKEAAYEAFKKLPPTVKTFISAVQGSGSNNQPYRDGKDKDNQGQDTRKVLTDLYSHAVAHPEGTTINKWIEMPDSMVQQFLKEPAGLVFQNPGSMCTSQHDKATSGFGKHRVVIHYAKGASAIDTFGSGGFAGEAEITTLPGARFMVLDRKMVPDVEHGKPNGTRLELEVLMLPPDPTYVSNLTKKA